jgi:hypothetical protein
MHEPLYCVIQEFNPGWIYCSKPFLDGLLDQEGRANAMVLTVDDGSFEAQRHTARSLIYFGLQTTLSVSSKRIQRVEIRIGRLNTRTVMERARGDQNIRGGNCSPLGACATRQIERHCPHIIINLQFGKCSFQISKYRTLTLGLRAVPKFEPDQRTPTRLAAFREHTFDPSPNICVALRPEEMNP